MEAVGLSLQSESDKVQPQILRLGLVQKAHQTSLRMTDCDGGELCFPTLPTRKSRKDGAGVQRSSGRGGFAQRWLGEGRIRLGEADKAVQIRARDAEAARGQRLVAVVLAHSGDGELDLVVAELALE